MAVCSIQWQHAKRMCSRNSTLYTSHHGEHTVPDTLFTFNNCLEHKHPQPSSKYILTFLPESDRLLATMSTVYITSYSTLKLDANPRAQSHFRSLLPPIPALLTLHCLNWQAPSSRTCSRYTGVSEPVQNVIYGSRTAMGEMYVFLSGSIVESVDLVLI
jgi:hypothetical protein